MHCNKLPGAVVVHSGKDLKPLSHHEFPEKKVWDAGSLLHCKPESNSLGPSLYKTARSQVIISMQGWESLKHVQLLPRVGVIFSFEKQPDLIV